MKNFMIIFILAVISKNSYAKWKNDGLLGLTNINQIFSRIGSVPNPCKSHIFEDIFGTLFKPYEIKDIKIQLVEGNRMEMSFKAQGYNIKAKGRFEHFPPGKLKIAVDKAELDSFFSVDVTDRVIDCFRESADGRFRVDGDDNIIIAL